VNCSLCSVPIQGVYTVYNDHTCVCRTCKRNFPACRLCGIPVSLGESSEDASFHRDCYKKALRCALCRSVIDGRYYVEHAALFGEERAICNACHRKVQSCDFCSRRVAQPMHRYLSGLLACQDCRRQAVVSELALQTQVSEVKSWLEQFVPGMTRFPVPILWKLLPADEMARQHGGAWGQFRRKNRVSGVYVRRSMRSSEGEHISHAIHIEEGLPLGSCQGVIAHELTHFWQRLILKQKLELEDAEGHATWVEYRFLEAKGFKTEATGLYFRRDYPYGTGLHRFLELEAKLKSASKVFQTLEFKQRIGGTLHDNPQGVFSVKA
jgi:hypothetical protein